MIREFFGKHRWQAFVMLAIMVTMPLTVIAYGMDDGWSPLRRGAIEPEGWRGGPLEDLIQDSMEGDDSLLRMLDHIGAMPESAQVPVQSHVLGLATPAKALPALYEAEALSSSTPLRTAVIAYNAGLELMDANELLASPDLRMADDLPLDAQVAIAVLLYAITDASLLQKQAVSGLSPEDYTALMGLPGMILAGRLDPTDSSEQADEDFAHAYGLLSQVDKQRIDEAALIMVHSVSHAMPTLREWGEREREQAQNPDARVQEIGSLLDKYTPARIEGMDPIERLDILADTLRMASGFQGVEVSPYLRPLPVPEGETPLRDSILDLAGVLEAAGLPLGDLVEERELRRADALPQSMQVAVARIVTNQAAVVQATMDVNKAVEAVESSIPIDALADPAALTDPGSLPDIPASKRDALLAALSDLRHAEIRTVLAVQQGAPTLEAWGLHWAREPGMLPATPAHAPGKLSDTAAMAGVMADPAASLEEVIRLAGQARGIEVDAAASPLPPRGSLADSVLTLYERLGIDADDATRNDIADGAMALPPVVEQNTARVLVAQLDALDALAELEASLSVEDHVAMMRGAAALERLEAGEVSLRDVQAIRAHYEVRDRIEATYLGAAAGVAAAIDASSKELGDYADEVTGYIEPVEETSTKSRPWYTKAWSAITSFQIIGTASAQSAPGEPIQAPAVCPDSALADCGNDVWFMDPLLETIVVSGFGETRFDPREMGKDWTRPDLPREEDRDPEWAAAVEPGGQLLSIDLGGDDVYRNNAGGAFATTIRGEVVRSIPVLPTVALDLGGEDRYLPAPAGYEYEAVQGAAVAGIGILYDRRGNDRYQAAEQAQGFAGAPGSFGIGVLLDGDGDDRYSADDHAQGSARGAGIGLLVDRAGSDQYTLSSDASGPATGQAGATGSGGVGSGGVGMLVDAQGSDTYEGGMQGQGTGGGIGVFVDLEGSDSHSRIDSEGKRFGNGECWSSLRSPQGSGYDVDNETFEDSDAVTEGAGVYVSNFLDDAQSVVTGGHGLFVDLDGSDCTYDPSDLLPVPAPEADPESLAEMVGSILGSEFLLEIPLVLVIGDEEDTHYPGCEVEEVFYSQWAQGAASRETCDYTVSVDLGGNDTYENRAGGVVVAMAGTSVPRYPPGLLLDVGGDDVYNNTRSECVQACNAMLLDLGGNDTFTANIRSQGIARSAGMSGILFNADGDDRYTIEKMTGLAQGAVEGAEAGIGLLLDVAGNDVYRSPSQGAVRSPIIATGFNLIARAAAGAGWTSATFLDLSGSDQYQPAGLQGRVDVVLATTAGGAASAPSISSRGSGTGIFVDAQGHDRYVGTPTNSMGPDFSSYQNNRSTIQSHAGLAAGTLFHAVPGVSAFFDLHGDDPEDMASQAGGFRQPADFHRSSFHVTALGIAIGTTDADVVHDDYTLFIDPGGNDAYRNNAGGTVLRAIQDTTVGEPGAFEEGGLSSTTYDPHRNYPLASLLIDLDGNDLYAADDAVDPNAPSPRPTKLKGVLTQGAGFLGTGILVDEAGNPAATAAGADASGAADDTYIARAMSQGFGLYGWGILWDRSGDDTYRYDPAVVRDPVLDGNLLAWLQYGPTVTDVRDPVTSGAPDGPGGQVAGTGSAGGASDATWNIHLRDGAWSRDCRIVVPGFGQGTFSGLAVAREADSRLAYSVVDDGLWRLHQVPDLPQSGDPCPGGTLQLDASEHKMREVEAIGGSRPASNQVNPQFLQIGNIDSILWQDDRDGTWSFYHKRLSHAVDDPAIPLGGGMLGGNESRASNQQNPFVHGSHLVYQDDRYAGASCPEGTSSIHRLNLNALQEEQVSQGCGFHANPQLSDTYIVWQTRASPDDSWDIAVYDRNKQILRIVTAPGDQYEPVVADKSILYTDSVDGHRVMQYDWDTNTSRTERFGAIQPVLDGQASFRAAWVDTTGRDATNQAPARSEYWEVHRKDLSSEAQPHTDGIRQSSVAGSVTSRWMTGASYASGRGIVFDEGGLDNYVGDVFSQGSSASLVGPSPNFQANTGLVGVSPTDAFGALVDGDGNDAYSARGGSQGVHLAREIFALLPPALPPPVGTPALFDVETMASLGLLLDVRGNDEFTANINSQGYGALALGTGTTVAACVGQAPHPGCPPYRLWAVGSFGIFMDLGGLDTYRYPQSLYQEISVQDDFCGTADSVAIQPLQSLLMGHNNTLRDTIGGFSTVGAYDEDGEPMSPPPPADVAEAEAEVFDRDQFNQDFNDTFEQPLWSIFEGAPDEVLEQVPPEIRAELDKTAFQALEDGVDGILVALVELCHEVEGIAMAHKDATEEELTGEPAGEPGERNNAVWRQKPRGGIEDGDGGRAAVPTPFVLGGVGMDLPLLDNLNRALMDVANELIDTELQVSAMDEDERLVEPGDLLQGTVKLIANVTFTGSSGDLGLEFDRAEFFADPGSGFRVLGTVVDSDSIGDRVLFNRTWHTDSEEFSDGSYDLRTRVHYRHPASGFNLGYAQNQTTFVVDNLPRILPDPVLPLLSDSRTQAPITEFSPFPYGDEQIPGHPVVTFGISSDNASATRGHDGWVRIDIVDGADDVWATLFDGTITSDEFMSRTWTGTDDAGDILPSDRYRLRIQATDREPGDWVDAVRVRDLTAPVVVYSNTPHTGCVSSSLNPGCNAGAILNVETGQVDAFGFLKVPLELDAVGDPGDAPPGLEEIRRFHVRLGKGPVNDVTWQDPVTLGVGSKTYDLRIRDGDTWHVLALAEDRAGNLECAPACGQRTDASVDRGEESTLLAAFAKKLETHGEAAFATFSADLQRPSIRNAKVFVDGDAPASLVPRIGPGALVTVTYQVEEENGKPNPILEWWHEEEPKRIRFPDITHPAVTIEEGDCEQASRTCYQATWQGWPDLVDTQTDPWKEGIIKTRLGAKDPALNPVRERDQPSFEFLLDRTAPTIDDYRVVYPGGRFHAESGDEVRIIVQASDPILSGFLTQPRDLSLAVTDASAVTGASEVEGTCTLRFEPGLCFQSQLKAWETVIPIDDTAWTDDPDLRAGRFHVAIDVTDVAGNTHPLLVELILGAPRLAPELETLVPGVFDASTSWSTDGETDAYLLYGEGTKASDLVHRIDSTVGSLHEFTLDELLPGRSHVYRFVAIDPDSEALEAGPLTTFSTLHGVEMELVAPSEAGEVLSGLYRVRGDGWVQSAALDDDLTIEPRVVLRLHGSTLPDAGRVVFDGFTEDGRFEMDLVTDALQDGTYTLEATVSYLGEQITTVVEDLLVDNSPPQLRFVAPVDEAILRERPDRLLVRVDDNLTAIDLTSVRVHVGGTLRSVDVDFHSDGDGHGGVLEITGLPNLRAGIVRLEILAQDMAGNPGFADIRVLYDPEAPEALADVLYPGDQQAARPGQWVTIEVAESGDAAGIARVTADATTLGGGNGLEFVRDARGHVLELPIPSTHEEGSYVLPVDVMDGAGNVRELTARVEVDTSRPTIVSMEQLPLDPHRAVVEVNASEPVTVVVEAVADGVATVRALADELVSLHVLELEGLQAGAEYAVAVTVRDRAGNEAAATQSWRFLPELGDVPAATNLTAAVTPHQVRLAWDGVGDGFRYAVHRAQVGAFETVHVAHESSFTDEVEPGEYRYFVQALDAQGRHGAPSRIVDVRVLLPDLEDEAAAVSVHPKTGVAGATEFVFTARLQGAREADPSAWLVIGDETRRMSKDAGEDCRDSCTFRHATVLPEIDLRRPTIEYHVEVFDASGGMRLPAAGSLEGPTVLAREDLDAMADKDTPSLGVLFVLATLATIVLIRRRNSL